MPDTGPSADDLAPWVRAALTLRPDLDAMSIAEALWLAASGPGVEGTRPPSADGQVEQENVNGPSKDRDSPSDVTTRPPVRRPNRADRQATVPGRLVRVGPAVRFPQRLQLERSLRPFKRRWQRGGRTRLDLDATIHAYTRTGQLVPVFEPAPERWFDAVVLRDDAPSMVIWAEETAGLSEVLRQAGTFKTVRNYRLSLSGTDGSAAGAPSLTTEAGVSERPGRLRAPDARRLIVIVTDGVAPGWRRPEIWQTIRTWAASTPTVLISPLAPRMWRQTGLDLPAAHVSPAAPGSRNAQLKFTVPLYLRKPGHRSGDWLPVPAVPLNPQRLRSWTRTLMRGDPAGCEALLIPPTGRVAVIGDGDEELAVDQDSVEAFLRLSSAPAARLAVLCSPFQTVSLALLRLIRQDLVPAAATEHLAEVIISGLFLPPETGANGVQFRFRDEARSVLQERLTESDLWRVYDVLRNRIDESPPGPGPAGTFTAAVRDPAGDIALPAGPQPGLTAAARDLMEFLDVLPDDVPVIETETTRENEAVATAGPDTENTLAGPPGGAGAENVLLDEAGEPVLDEADDPIAADSGLHVAAGSGDIHFAAGRELTVNNYYPSSRSLPSVVVVGEVPQEPAAFQPRPGLLAALQAERGVTVVRAITGMRGVGKTQLAAAYARQCISAGWRLVAWIDASDEEHLLIGLAEVAADLALNPTETAATAARQVRHWLEADGEHCLLVFDNLSDPSLVRPYLPAAGQARVLITTTVASVAFLGQPLSLSVFAEDEAVEYLMERTGREDVDGAREVARELGYLPLALAQAAAVISKQRLSYRVYLQRLRSLPIQGYLPRAVGDAYPHGVAETILLSLDAVADGASGLSVALLQITALLADSGVSRSLLHSAATAENLADPVSGPVTVELVDEAIGQLAEASLLSFSIDGETVSAHPLVRRVIRESLGQRGLLLTAIGNAAAMLSKRAGELSGLRNSLAMRDIALQVTALLYYVGDAYETDTDLTERILYLRLYALYYLNVLGDSWPQAIATGESLAADLTRLRGPDDPSTLAAVSGLTSAYFAAGRLVETVVGYQRALAGYETAFGPDDVRTIQARGNLALASHAIGGVDDAIALHEQTLSDFERVLGEGHLFILAERNNLADAYQSAGRTGDAISLLEPTVARREQVLGRDHPDTLSSRNNLAVSYQAVGRSDQALSWFEQTLADRERVLGPDHPDTLSSRNNLARVLHERGRLADALPLLEQTLTARRQLLGPDHPDTLDTLNNLAIALQDQGRAGEALPLLEEALSGSERALGENHPSTLITRNNLAGALRAARAVRGGSAPRAEPGRPGAGARP